MIVIYDCSPEDFDKHNIFHGNCPVVNGCDTPISSVIVNAQNGSRYLFTVFPRNARPSSGMGNDPFVDAAEYTSFPLPGTGKREGGEKTQSLHHFPSHLGTGLGSNPHDNVNLC